MSQKFTIGVREACTIFENMDHEEAKRRTRFSEIISGRKIRAGIEYIPLGIESDLEFQVLKVRFRKNDPYRKRRSSIYAIFLEFKNDSKEVSLIPVSSRSLLYFVYPTEKIFSRRYIIEEVSQIEMFSFTKMFLKFIDPQNGYFLRKKGEILAYEINGQTLDDFP